MDCFFLLVTAYQLSTAQSMACPMPHVNKGPRLPHTFIIPPKKQSLTHFKECALDLTMTLLLMAFGSSVSGLWMQSGLQYAQVYQP